MINKGSVNAFTEPLLMIMFVLNTVGITEPKARTIRNRRRIEINTGVQLKNPTETRGDGGRGPNGKYAERGP